MLLYVKITKLQNGVDLPLIFVLLHLYRMHVEYFRVHFRLLLKH